jgi:hypothetical protein
MIEKERAELDHEEQRALGLSMQSGLSDKRTRNILLSGGASLLGVCLFSVYGVGITFITAMATALILIAAIEKLSYSREILVYRSLVRRLSRRIEDLEDEDVMPLSDGALQDVVNTPRVVAAPVSIELGQQAPPRLHRFSSETLSKPTP